MDLFILIYFGAIQTNYAQGKKNLKVVLKVVPWLFIVNLMTDILPALCASLTSAQELSGCTWIKHSIQIMRY